MMTIFHNIIFVVILLCSSFLKLGISIVSPYLEIDFSNYSDDVDAPFDLYGGAEILPVGDGYNFSALRTLAGGQYSKIPNVDISPSKMPYCTVMVTAKLESIANDFGFIVSNDDGGWDRTIAMHSSSSNRSIAANAGFPWSAWDSPSPPDLDRWYHVTAVFRPNGEECSLWVDGIKADKTATCNLNNNGTNYLLVSAHPKFPNEDKNVDGWIRKVSIFDEALDATSIAYHASKALPNISSFAWDLALDTPGYLKNPPIQDGVQEFITTYNMSDRHYEMEVFKADCSTPTDGLTLINTNDSKDSGSNHLEVTFLYNQSVVQESNLWTSNSTGGDVDFCLKLSLYSNSSDGILFNFIETIYKVEVDLVSGFSTEVDVVRTAAGDGGVSTFDVDENITVYQCNDAYDAINPPPALTQGEALQICVETEYGSVFEVASFKDVKISQNGTKAFDYVTNFADSYWASSSCKDTNTPASVCKLKMQLLGDYFVNADPADLTVEGVVKMDYLGRRVLRELKSISTDDAAAAALGGADFSIDVAIASGSNTDNEGYDMKDTVDVGSTVASDDMSGGMLEYVNILVSTSIIVLMTAIGVGVGRIVA